MPIAVTDIAHVRFQAPDLDAVADFYVDFGLAVADRTDDRLALAARDGRIVHMTERADEAGFVGLGFDVATNDELGVLAAEDGFEPTDDDLLGPVAVAADPDGWRIEIVVAPSPVPAAHSPAPLRNDARHRTRLGAPLRFDAGASHVERLGHCVLDVTDFRTSEAWYKRHLGLVTSDEIRLDEDRALGAFLRCDRGAAYVDHHTMFLVGAGRAGFNHAAFEVTDHDDLMVGHTHLHAQGRDPQWGVGRHILGSQVYDYWNDPNGFMVEHWTDGDLYNDERPPRIASVDELLGSQWGPTAGAAPGNRR